MSSLSPDSLYWKLMSMIIAEERKGRVLSIKIEQKLVAEKDVQEHLKNGWLVRTSISPSSVVLERMMPASDTTTDITPTYSQMIEIAALRDFALWELLGGGYGNVTGSASFSGQIAFLGAVYELSKHLSDSEAKTVREAALSSLKSLVSRAPS